jgi:ATP-dependent helicase HrpB
MSCRSAMRAAAVARWSWFARRAAPARVKLAKGRSVAVNYVDGQTPWVASRLQDFFGMRQTPLVGQTPVVVHLLAPNQRPVQVTRDLAGFWRSSYFEVRKELRGRYPRHPWPEDPLTAEATRRAKPRGT